VYIILSIQKGRIPPGIKKGRGNSPARKEKGYVPPHSKRRQRKSGRTRRKEKVTPAASSSPGREKRNSGR